MDLRNHGRTGAPLFISLSDAKEELWLFLIHCLHSNTELTFGLQSPSLLSLLLAVQYGSKEMDFELMARDLLHTLKNLGSSFSILVKRVTTLSSCGLSREGHCDVMRDLYRILAYTYHHQFAACVLFTTCTVDLNYPKPNHFDDF
jgi:hypothetical protein